jgi:hypothetical protein
MTILYLVPSIMYPEPDISHTGYIMHLGKEVMYMYVFGGQGV